MNEIMDPNAKIIERVLNNFHGETRKNRKRVIVRLFKAIYANYTPKFILDYSVTELREVLDWIEAQKIGIENKNRYLNVLKKIIEEAEFPYKVHGKKYNNIDYGFLLKTKRFSDTRNKKIRKVYLTAEKWNEISKIAKSRDFIDYALIMIFRSGCRPTAITRLKWEDVNFQHCYFDVIEKSGKCRYFFPTELSPILRTLQLMYDYNGYVFGIRTLAPLDRRIRKYIGAGAKNFRRSIKRLWMEVGMDANYRNMLANHKPTMDGIYAIGNMAWEQPEKAHKIYQKYYNLIFLVLGNEKKKNDITVISQFNGPNGVQKKTISQ